MINSVVYTLPGVIRLALDRPVSTLAVLPRNTRRPATHVAYPRGRAFPSARLCANGRLALVGIKKLYTHEYAGLNRQLPNIPRQGSCRSPWLSCM